MRFSLLLSAAIVWSFAAIGCNQKDDTTKPDAKPVSKGHSHDDHAGHEHEGHGHEGHDNDHHADAKTEHVHGEWWCGEHGVPEHICGLCNVEYANTQKKAGDWCKDHQRPASQCFACKPDLKEHFAAMYRAKYPGNEPPPITEE